MNRDHRRPNSSFRGDSLPFRVEIDSTRLENTSINQNANESLTYFYTRYYLSLPLFFTSSCVFFPSSSLPPFRRIVGKLRFKFATRGNRLQFVKNETSRRSWRNARNHDAKARPSFRFNYANRDRSAERHSSPASSNFVHQRDRIRAILLPSNNQNSRIATPFFSSAFRTRKLKSSFEYRPSFSNSLVRNLRTFPALFFRVLLSSTNIENDSFENSRFNLATEREKNNHATHTLLTKSLIFPAASVIYQKRITLGKASG